ncbi:MAG: hypothetical protein ACK5LZ_04825 [Anaerorhabdus sp.]
MSLRDKAKELLEVYGMDEDFLLLPQLEKILEEDSEDGLKLIEKELKKLMDEAE